MTCRLFLVLCVLAVLLAVSSAGMSPVRAEPPRFSIVAPGIAHAIFKVRVSRASAKPVSVRFATAPTVGQGATAGTDFVARSGLLVFKARETRKVVRIEVFGDTVAEDDEFFDLRLTGARGARIAPSGGRATIAFNDLPGLFTLKTEMSGAQAVPSQAASYSGTATITLDPAAARLSFTITVSGPSGAVEGIFAHSELSGQSAPICGCGNTLVAKLAPMPPVPGASSGNDILISRESIIALYNDPSRFAVSVAAKLSPPAVSELMRGQFSRVG